MGFNEKKKKKHCAELFKIKGNEIIKIRFVFFSFFFFVLKANGVYVTQ